MGIYANALKTIREKTEKGLQVLKEKAASAEKPETTTTTRITTTTSASPSRGVGTYTQRMPDMSRNTALAGKTVYADGMNVTYDQDGYAVGATNPLHRLFAGTDRSVRAPSIDAALAKDRSGYGGSSYDKAHFSNTELARADDARRAAQSGQIGWDTANGIVENIRSRYGYRGGADGSGYTKDSYIIFNPEDPTTQPLSDRFGSGAGATQNWTTQQNQWDDAYRYGGGLSGAGQGLYGAGSGAQGQAYLPETEPAYGPGGIDPALRGGTTLIGGQEPVYGPGGINPDLRDGTTSAGGDLTEQLLRLYGENGTYAQALAAQRAAQEAATAQAVNELEGRRTETENAYLDLYRQAYIDRMNAQKNIGQRMAAQGVTGGAAESTLLGLENGYADTLRRAEQSRIGELGTLERAITDARLSGELQSAQALAEAQRNRTDRYASVLQALISRNDALEAQKRAAENEAWNRWYQLSRDAVSDQRYQDEWDYRRQSDQWNRQYQLGRDNVADQRYQNEWGYQLQNNAYNTLEQSAKEQREWARKLAQSMLALGNMPDDDTLALAGMTRAQAQALLPQTTEPVYTPTFSQAQVLSAAAKGALSGNLLRDYNWYLYGDPDYGARR